MYIKIYVLPNGDSSSVADQAKMIVEQMTGLPCNVRVSGPRNVKPNPYVSAITDRNRMTTVL